MLTEVRAVCHTSMKGQSAGEDLTALGGSLTEALLFRLPSVMAWALGMALSLPSRPGESFSSPSPAFLELLLPMNAAATPLAGHQALDTATLSTPCMGT